MSSAVARKLARLGQGTDIQQGGMAEAFRNSRTRAQGSALRGHAAATRKVQRDRRDLHCAVPATGGTGEPSGK